VALLYRGFATPVLLTVGAAAELAPVLMGLAEPEVYLSVRPDVHEVVRRRYHVRDEAAMWRMAVAPGALRLARGAFRARRLTLTDAMALGDLYADGQATGEVPGFFRLSMVRDGVFYGIYESRAMVAAAGTHLVSRAESVAAIGNVYTRRDRRGRGLGRAVTGAVAAELVRLGIRTVVLNVAQANAPAIRAYEALGFRRHCAFLEGLAHR
jgi:ribosomal protein S18 acetylase RimI-like enzyme